jgi:plasmid maintenance system antidote protein VapI
MLLEEFLNLMQIKERQLADAIDVLYQRVNEIINGRRGVTAAMPYKPHPVLIGKVKFISVSEQ